MRKLLKTLIVLVVYGSFLIYHNPVVGGDERAKHLVPGEKNLDNNSATYQVLFILASGQ